MKGLVRKTYPTWNKVYRVSFSIIVNKLPHAQWANVIHFTTGGNNGVYGNRNPAVWINKRFQGISIVSAVSGNNYWRDYKISFGKQYDITIQQSKQNGKYWYEILINNILRLRVHNTKPIIFSNVKEYISDPWHYSFTSDLGTIFNLKVKSKGDKNGELLQYHTSLAI